MTATFRDFGPMLERVGREEMATFGSPEDPVPFMAAMADMPYERMLDGLKALTILRLEIEESAMKCAGFFAAFGGDPELEATFYGVTRRLRGYEWIIRRIASEASSESVDAVRDEFTKLRDERKRQRRPRRQRPAATAASNGAAPDGE